MEQLHSFIEQYWAGTISNADKQQLMALLEEKGNSFSDEEYRTFTALVNEEQTLLNRQDPALQQAFAGITSRLKLQEPGKTRSVVAFPNWSWAAAAALLFAIAGAWWFTRPGHQTTEWVNVTGAKDTSLPDGSVIHLYAGTNISFANGFHEKERAIKLNGRARFQVAKDDARPFIVYASGFATQALGTTFEINTLENGKFSAHLLEGKIVVKSTDRRAHPMADVYLSANEQLAYDLGQKQYTVGVTSNKTTVSPVKTEQPAAPELAFTKLPLPVVFKMLEQEYGIVIECDAAKISDIEYSGTFSKSSPPFAILNKISRQYHLTLKKEAGIYKIE